jgi:hypothetical protein
MDKATIMKIVVVLVAILFIIGMFNYFEKEQVKKAGAQNLTVVENYSMAEGIAKGKVQSFSNTLYVTPWNETYRGILDSLKSENQIEYLNIINDVATITIPPKANASYIREKLSSIDADVFIAANVVFSESVNFTLLNGSTKMMSIGAVEAKLDPQTPLGEIIEASVTADVSQNDIKNIRVSMTPKISNATVETVLSCGSSYQIQGTVLWENRVINTSSYVSLLNVSDDKINYTREDSVILPKKLNDNESAEIRNKNLSYIFYIMEDTIYVNSTSKSQIESDLSFLGKNFIYPNSTINAIFESDANKIESIVEELNKTISGVQMKRNCGINLSTVSINGTNYYVQRNAKSTENYLDLAKSTGIDKRNVSIEIYTIGRSVTKIAILDIQ